MLNMYFAMVYVLLNHLLLKLEEVLNVIENQLDFPTRLTVLI